MQWLPTHVYGGLAYWFGLHGYLYNLYISCEWIEERKKCSKKKKSSFIFSSVSMWMSLIWLYLLISFIIIFNEILLKNWHPIVLSNLHNFRQMWLKRRRKRKKTPLRKMLARGRNGCFVGKQFLCCFFGGIFFYDYNTVKVITNPQVIIRNNYLTTSGFHFFV